MLTNGKGLPIAFRHLAALAGGLAVGTGRAGLRRRNRAVQWRAQPRRPRRQSFRRAVGSSPATDSREAGWRGQAADPRGVAQEAHPPAAGPTTAGREARTQATDPMAARQRGRTRVAPRRAVAVPDVDRRPPAGGRLVRTRWSRV